MASTITRNAKTIATANDALRTSIRAERLLAIRAAAASNDRRGRGYSARRRTAIACDRKKQDAGRTASLGALCRRRQPWWAALMARAAFLAPRGSSLFLRLGSASDRRRYRGRKAKSKWQFALRRKLRFVTGAAPWPAPSPAWSRARGSPRACRGRPCLAPARSRPWRAGP